MICQVMDELAARRRTMMNQLDLLTEEEMTH